MTPQEKSGVEESIDDNVRDITLQEVLAKAEKEMKEVAELKKKALNLTEGLGPLLWKDSMFPEAFGSEGDKNLEGDIEMQEANKSGKLDSSDNDKMENLLEHKYISNEYDCDINKELKEQKEVAKDTKGEKSKDTSVSMLSSVGMESVRSPIKRKSLITASFKDLLEQRLLGNKQEYESNDSGKEDIICTDPVFGLRIINPVMPDIMLSQRMNGYQVVSFLGIASHAQRADLSKDWVIGGVLVRKSPIQMGKNNQPYSIWHLTDLKREIRTISLFLFNGAHRELWKTAEGMCMAVFNPTILEKREESKDLACLSVDTAGKVMHLGKSKDLGTCKAMKRKGEVCNAIVNLSECDKCIFHIRQKSSRSSANTGKGLSDLRKKVLGKSEVFYGGKIFSAKKSPKLIKRDKEIISFLSKSAVPPSAIGTDHSSKPKLMQAPSIPYVSKEGPVSKKASNIESSTKQRLKDFVRLRTLREESEQKCAKLEAESSVTEVAPPSTSEQRKYIDYVFSKSQPSEFCSLSPSSSQSLSLPSTSKIREIFKKCEFSFTSTIKSPQLPIDSSTISKNIREQRNQLAKLKAIDVIKNKPLEIVDPNALRGTQEGKRRAMERLNEQYMPLEEKQKLAEEKKEQERKNRIQRVMDTSSSHADLVDMREKEELDKYFNKLEKKEALEEKMLNTFKVPCKAVICKICKYIAFTPGDRCKEEGHDLKVSDAEKRFFQCRDCGTRTITLFKLPKFSCGKCRSSRWKRCPMIREREIPGSSNKLSLRGDEERFIGTISGEANLNLLVPDD